jgi:hypothetical protein
MKKSDQKRAEWRGRLEEAEKHPKGIAGYAREAGVSAIRLYNWKARLKKESQTALPQDPGEAFCRVKVIEPRRSPLPDPKWVAELILALASGARSR